MFVLFKMNTSTSTFFTRELLSYVFGLVPPGRGKTPDINAIFISLQLN